VQLRPGHKTAKKKLCSLPPVFAWAKSARSGLAQQPRPLLAPGPLHAQDEVGEDFPNRFPGFSSVLSESSVQWIRGVEVAWR
jgi:hypothetical protein